MKRFHLLIIALAALTLSSCAPRISGRMSKAYPELKEDAPVIVLAKDTPVPDKCVKIGTLNLGPARFTSREDGTFDKMMETARKTALKFGGNIIRVIDYLPADENSNTDRLWMEVYYRNGLEGLQSTLTSAPASSNIAELRRIYDIPTKEQIPATFRTAVNVGYGLRTVQPLGENETSAEETLHNRKMNSGLSLSADAEFYLDNHIGAGIRISNLHSSNTDMMPVTFDATTRVTSAFAETTDIIFAGPVITVRASSKDMKHTFVGNIGAGEVFYRQRISITPGQAGIDPVAYKVKGGNLGGCLDLNYDYAITKKLSVGANLSYVLGYITRAWIKNSDGSDLEQDDGTRVELSHISLNAGIRYSF